jgi:c(7)-type cytochrome triheme protein
MHKGALRILVAVIGALVLAQAAAQVGLTPPPQAPQAIVRSWAPLAKDGIHDPRSPAVTLKQQPAEALSVLPPDRVGNQVRWVRALEEGAINPRTSIFPETAVRLREDEIIVAKYGSMPAVVFPHRQHTLWLDCSNCHEKLFVSKAGANKLSMQRILDGEQCGLCHGAVSFPLTECLRCHSLPNERVKERLLGVAKP